MGKFDGILLCTDLDGTFTRNGNEVCADNLEWVRYFEKEGGLFTVATGRLPPHLETFGDSLPTNVPVITHNGAVIFDRASKKVLYRRPMENANGEVRDAIRFVHSCDVADQVDLCAEMTWIDEKTALREDDRTVYYKGVVACRSEEDALRLVRLLKETYHEQYCVFRSWSVGVEFLAPDSNKGSALTALKAMLGSRVKMTVAVGDCENDAFMLRTADRGYTVENGTAEAKAAADAVVCHFEKGAIAEIIRMLDEEIVSRG